MLYIQVSFASSCDIPFLGSSGRHGFSTDLGKLHHGIEIDMSAFRNVSVNAKDSTLTVGGGVRFLDVFDPVFDAGKEISPLESSLEEIIETLTNTATRYWVGRLRRNDISYHWWRRWSPPRTSWHDFGSTTERTHGHC